MRKLGKKSLPKCAKFLFKAFLRWYDPENSFSITSGRITLKMFFQEPDSDNTKLSEDISAEGLEEHEEETTQGETEKDSEQRDAVTESYSYEETTEDISAEGLEEHEEETAQCKTEKDSEQKDAVTESYSYEETTEDISDEGLEEHEEETTQGETENDSEQKSAITEKCMGEALATDREISKENNPSDKRNRRGMKINTSLKIPELEEIAKKSTSFDNFAELVAKWLGVGSKTEDIKELLIVSAEIDELSMNALKKAFQNKNVSFFRYATILLRKSFNEKWTEHDVTPMAFLYAIRKYRTYPFKLSETAEESYAAEQKKANEQVSEESVQTAVTKSNEVVIPKARVKMECMPEIKDFEEVLANVDKTQPIKERIRYVFEAMGLEKLDSKDQDIIIEYANMLIRKNDVFAGINDINIPQEEKFEMSLKFSKLLNDFVRRYYSGIRVKHSIFISELQKIIMFENEIKK